MIEGRENGITPFGGGGCYRRSPQSPKLDINLGYAEWENGRFERAVNHLVIAAKLGYDYDDSIKPLKQLYAAGYVSNEDFVAALRAHQAAVNATKSPQREAAARAEAVQQERKRVGE